MKAVVYSRYGSPDNLQYADIPRPNARKGEVLLRIHSASLNSFDWRHLRADPFIIRLTGAGVFSPGNRVLGGDIAGTVEGIGNGVTRFKPGDEVFGGNTFGGYAEYACIPEDKLVLKPLSLLFDDAASVVTAGLTALQALRMKGGTQPGHKVLVNGASGGVGVFAVQLARHFGAVVTGVSSASKTDLVLTAGAHHIIDYEKEDITRSDVRYDRILDIAAKRSITDYKRILARNGQYVMLGGEMRRILQLMLLKMTGLKNMDVMLASMNKDDLVFLGDLLERGVIRNYVDKVFPLSELKQAMWYYEKGKVRGKVVIRAG